MIMQVKKRFSNKTDAQERAKWIRKQGLRAEVRMVPKRGKVGIHYVVIVRKG